MASNRGSKREVKVPARYTKDNLVSASKSKVSTPSKPIDYYVCQCKYSIVIVNSKCRVLYDSIFYGRASSRIIVDLNALTNSCTHFKIALFMF